MMRLLGAALLTAGCTAAGFAAAGELSGRVQDLDALIRILEALGRELEFALRPLPEALLQAAAGCNGGKAVRWFRTLAEELQKQQGDRQQEVTFQNLWSRSLAESGLCREQAERAVLEAVGNVLGRYDALSQKRALEQAAERLRELRQEAEERRARLGGMYRGLGPAAGALLAVLLL